MSGSDSDFGSAPGQREVAYRLFAAEFDDSELSYSESDEERAPNYVVTPTGARVNRLFAVGVLTEVEDVNPEMVRGRIVDPTGAFVTYAGQYQPDALAFLERADPPAFLALSGKARTYEPEDGDRIYTSVRPESVSEVDADTRDRWVVTAADRTLERIGVMASAIESGLVGDQLRAALIDAGVDDRLADGVALALDHYGTTPAYLDALRNVAIDAVEVVAGQRDEVGRLELSPDEGMGDAASLSTLDLSGAPSPQTAAAAADVTAAEDSDETGTVGVSGSDPGSTGASATADDSVETEPELDESAAESVSEPDGETTAEISSEPSSADDTSISTDDPADTPISTDDPADTSAETDDLGGSGESDEAADDFDPDDFDPSEFELDEEERREVEEEYGTEFSTADEVEPAESLQNEAVSETGETAEAPDTASTEAVAESTDSSEVEGDGSDVEPPATGEADTEASPTEDDGAAAVDGDVDIEDAVMAAMEELDDGDGADRDQLVQTVVDEHGWSADDVEAAIQDALMGGRCYEPSDGTLKSI